MGELTSWENKLIDPPSGEDECQACGRLVSDTYECDACGGIFCGECLDGHDCDGLDEDMEIED